MKNKFSLICILAILSSSVTAQWKIEEIFGRERTVAKIQFFPNGNGYVAGQDKILKLDSLGKIINSKLFTGNNFKSIYFIDEHTGWACGFNGLIMQTSDGGENWGTQNSNTVYNLYSLTFTNSLTGRLGEMGVQ